MPEEDQLSCQKPYSSDYMMFMAYLAKNIKLLIPHGNGHRCTITDGNKHMLRN
jgi:hypothetical protein